jgi:hypothetical protein
MLVLNATFNKRKYAYSISEKRVVCRHIDKPIEIHNSECSKTRKIRFYASVNTRWTTKPLLPLNYSNMWIVQQISFQPLTSLVSLLKRLWTVCLCHGMVTTKTWQKCIGVRLQYIREANGMSSYWQTNWNTWQWM